MRKIGYIQIIISYCIFIFIILYYNLFNKNHNQDLELWLIILIAIGFINLVIALFFSYRRFDKNGEYIINNENDKIEKILKFIVLIPVFAIAIPLMIIPLIILSVGILYENISFKKMLKKIKKKGYSVNKEPKLEKYTFSKNNIVVKIYRFSEYSISYDYGNTFINIIDCNLGSQEERDSLKKIYIDYQKAHPVDKQRGDAIDPTEKFILFLIRHLQ